jgi:hypothetical protein
MKNIYILPTYKLSRLTKALHYSNVLRLVHQNYKCNVKDEQYQHIYITSDEEITPGYWLDLADNSIVKTTSEDLIKFKSYDKIQFKKIILTTDEDLIKEGVQAIDDDFLEWFVKNPSCEWVELSLEETQYGNGIYEYVIYKKEIPKEEPKKIFDLPIATNLGSALTETMKSVSQHEGGIKQGEINLPSFKEEVCICTDECLGYLTKTCKRIEEPKKEPKQRLEKYSERFDNKENEVVDGIFDSENWGRRVVKQETLEEVAETELYRIINKIIDGGRDLPKGVNVSRGHAVDYAFEIALKVCKWQQEQNKNLYSEEDLEKAYKDGGRNEYDFINKYHCKARISFDKWFEQFKK